MRSTNVIALALSVALLTSSAVEAAQGDCGQPVSSGPQPSASDCLFVLRTSVGSETCTPECVCDTNGSADTTASDALVCLKKAVGQDVDLKCRCPVSPVGDQLQVNTYATGGQIRPAVAADAQGNFVVVWESTGSSGTDSAGYSIQAQRFLSTGEALGAEFQINTLTAEDQFLAAVGAHPDGSFVVAWDHAGASAGDTAGSVRAQRFDSNGAPVGTEFQVNTYTTLGQGTASVAVDPESGSFVIVWQSEGSSGTDVANFSIQGQRYDSDGNAAGTEFQVNTLTGDSQLAPSVSYRGGGRFVVAWTSLAGSGTDPDTNARAQAFLADGARDSTEFRLNSYTTGTQSNPSVSSDGAGGFVIVWQSYGSAYDSDFAIAGRQFGPTGQTGNEFSINTFTTGAQTDARVTLLDPTRFVVVWNSTGPTPDDADYGVRGQVFGTDGVAIGSEFQVNAFTTLGQSAPDVAAGPDNFMVVWEDVGTPGSDASGYSIQGQRFE